MVPADLLVVVAVLVVPEEEVKDITMETKEVLAVQLDQPVAVDLPDQLLLMVEPVELAEHADKVELVELVVPEEHTVTRVALV